MRSKLSIPACKEALRWFRASQSVMRSDQEIFDYLKSRLPYDSSLTDATVVSKIRARYNAGTGKFFKKFGPAGQIAEMPIWNKYERDANGAYYQVEERKRTRRPRPAFSTEALQALIRAEVAKCSSPVIHVHVPERPTVTLTAGSVHYKFQEAMDIIAAGLNLYLVGPAGCGKSTLGRNIATALSRDFRMISMSEGATEAQLYGRSIPADNHSMRFVPGPFTDAFLNGCVFLLDEIDSGEPNTLLSLNAAIDNGILTVPAMQAEPLHKHRDFICIAAANTVGTGADRKYVGRNRLDAATLDRFVLGMVELDYDQTLERSIASALIADPEELLQWAWQVRSRIVATGVDRLISTRCIRNAANLLRIGKDMDYIKAQFFKSWKRDEYEKVRV